MPEDDAAIIDGTAVWFPRWMLATGACFLSTLLVGLCAAGSLPRVAFESAIVPIAIAVIIGILYLWGIRMVMCCIGFISDVCDGSGTSNGESLEKEDGIRCCLSVPLICILVSGFLAAAKVDGNLAGMTWHQVFAPMYFLGVCCLLLGGALVVIAFIARNQPAPSHDAEDFPLYLGAGIGILCLCVLPVITCVLVARNLGAAEAAQASPLDAGVRAASWGAVFLPVFIAIAAGLVYMCGVALLSAKRAQGLDPAQPYNEPYLTQLCMPGFGCYHTCRNYQPAELDLECLPPHLRRYGALLCGHVAYIGVMAALLIAFVALVIRYANSGNAAQIFAIFVPLLIMSVIVCACLLYYIWDQRYDTSTGALPTSSTPAPVSAADSSTPTAAATTTPASPTSTPNTPSRPLLKHDASLPPDEPEPTECVACGKALPPKRGDWMILAACQHAFHAECAAERRRTGARCAGCVAKEKEAREASSLKELAPKSPKTLRWDESLATANEPTRRSGGGAQAPARLEPHRAAHREGDRDRGANKHGQHKPHHGGGARRGGRGGAGSHSSSSLNTDSHDGDEYYSGSDDHASRSRA